MPISKHRKTSYFTQNSGRCENRESWKGCGTVDLYRNVCSMTRYHCARVQYAGTVSPSRSYVKNDLSTPPDLPPSHTYVTLKDGGVSEWVMYFFWLNIWLKDEIRENEIILGYHRQTRVTFGFKRRSICSDVFCQMKCGNVKRRYIRDEGDKQTDYHIHDEAGFLIKILKMYHLEVE